MSNTLKLLGLTALGCALLVRPVVVSQADRSTSPQTGELATKAADDSRLPLAEQQQLLRRYCLGCHNERLKTGGLVLNPADLERLDAATEHWEKVVRKLRAGVMPPAGRPRPDPMLLTRFIATIEANLDEAFSKAPNVGRVSLHRLNRSEYVNAIRDVLGLQVDGKVLLPADDAGYGFDNIADVLTVSPGLLERYLLVAKKISRLAIGDPTLRPAVTTYSVPYTMYQEERASEDLPFGSRGGLAVRHHFPLDGEYVIKVRLQRHSQTIGNQIRGLDVENEIDVRIDNVRVALFKPPTRKYEGGYTATEDTLDSAFDATVAVKAGTHVVGVALNPNNWYVEGVGMSRLPATSDGYTSGLKTEQNFGKIEMGIDHIDIAGPFSTGGAEDTPSRRKIFTCYPRERRDEVQCASTILTQLARRAYRRPPSSEDVRALMGFFETGRREDGFERGIQRAIERMLIDPDFLFRVEREPAGVVPGAPYRISDIELASRLAFFLWSSVPDDELIDLAVQRKLSEPAELERQVRRMLADVKSDAFLNNFFGQWLYLRNVATTQRDSMIFPEFDDALRRAFEQETALFLASQVRDDRPVTELLTANYTFVNERLARHYRIPNVYGSRFRRVELSDGKRAGILGHGSLLTVTSYADRTSPVFRGKWILENILGTPPPPPPADVPPLGEDAASLASSMRSRMEQHRKNPVCASCHSMLDPLGFALENFDGIGKWRDRDGDSEVDASGALPDGTAFKHPSDFRQALLKRQDAFLGTLTEKLLTYALGRGVEFYDMPAVRTIVRQAAEDGLKWSSFVLATVRSAPFQMRMASEPSTNRAADAPARKAN